MNRFHIVDEAAVILRSKGVYRQVKVYLRGDGVYAAHGGGFIRLYKNGGTGLPNVSWDDIDLGVARGSGYDALDKMRAVDIKQIEGGA